MKNVMTINETPRIAVLDGASDGASPRTVAIAGVLDLSTVAGLEEGLNALIDAGHTRLIVDLTGVRLCAAAGMSGLERVSRRCAERGGWLRLACPVGVVATVFEIVSFGRSVEVYRTVAAAADAATQSRIMR
jgi:anti-anti-sigma factor